jgi:hypothetical protein
VEVEKKIEEKIEQFICWVEKHPNKKSQVSYLLVEFGFYSLVGSASDIVWVEV